MSSDNRQMMSAILVLSMLMLLNVSQYPVICANHMKTGDYLNWKCANNATCLHEMVSEMSNILNESREPINFGRFSIEPITPIPIKSTGRSSSIWNFLSGHAIKVPIGPMLFSIQRSDKYEDYIEVALIKKVVNKENARRRGGFGGKEKKHLQLFIPTFLAFNAVGWMMLAVKAVALLVVKAIVVSKLALIVTLFFITRKVLSSVNEKYSASPFGHPEPIMMPYSMDYTLPASYHGTDLGASDLFVHMPSGHEPSAFDGSNTLNGESANLKTVVHALPQAQALVAAQSPQVQKIKRQDSNADKAGIQQNPLLYNYLMPSREPILVYNGLQ